MPGLSLPDSPDVMIREDWGVGYTHFFGWVTSIPILIKIVTKIKSIKK